MTTTETIPAAAIEAAAAALSLVSFDVEWEHMGETGRNACRAEATAALTAAAPIIAAQALRDAVSDFESNVGVAEFDEQTRRDGCHHTYADEAWDHQSAYMDWLRNRADQIDGGSK